MKKIFWLFLFPILGFSQQDSIFTSDGKIVIGTITLINDQNIFYNNKKQPAGVIALSKVTRYVTKISKEEKKINVSDPILDTSSVNKIVIVDGVDINKLKIHYCEICGYMVLPFQSRLKIGIDYGQGVGFNSSTEIKNQLGQIMSFNSIVDALNFMVRSGRELETAYASRYGDGGLIYKYLLKRKN